MSAKFSDAEKVDLLIKKFFGKPSTSLDNKFYGEPSIDSRPGVFPSQIYSDPIPTTAPARPMVARPAPINLAACKIILIFMFIDIYVIITDCGNHLWISPIGVEPIVKLSWATRFTN